MQGIQAPKYPISSSPLNIRLPITLFTPLSPPVQTANHSHKLADCSHFNSPPTPRLLSLVSTMKLSGSLRSSTAPFDCALYSLSWFNNAFNNFSSQSILLFFFYQAPGLMALILSTSIIIYFTCPFINLFHGPSLLFFTLRRLFSLFLHSFKAPYNSDIFLFWWKAFHPKPQLSFTLHRLSHLLNIFSIVDVTFVAHHTKINIWLT